MARDILLSHVHGMPARRATRDVDIGLFVESWYRFDALKRHLIVSSAFFPLEGAPQRPDVVAEALKTIRHSALLTGDCSRSKAITAGSTYRNLAQRRLREAEKAADEARVAQALRDSAA